MEKRMAGDYEIIQAFHIGEKEVVIGEKKNAAPGEKYMCGYCQWNGFFENYTEAIADDDYCEVVKLYAERVFEQAEKARTAMFKPKFQGIDTTPLTAGDCYVISDKDDIRGKVIVIKAEALRREYRTATNQIMLCLSGFGASPNSRGNACYCIDLYSGAKCRQERPDVLGTLEENQLPQWAQLGLDQYRQSQRQKPGKGKEGR